MTTTMQVAFAAAARVQLAAKPFARTSKAFKEAEAEHEIQWFGKHWVYAAPIPEHYLAQRIALTKLETERSARQLTVVSHAMMEREGFVDPAQFAAAQMKEHLAETAHIAGQVSHVDETTGRAFGHMPEPSGELPVYVKREPRVFHGPVRPKEFSIADMVEKPSDLVDEREYDRAIAGALHAVVALGDWDESLAYAQLKEWDALAACYERLLFNTEQFGVKSSQELQRLYREADAKNDEVPRQQVERLQRQLQGLRVQYWYYRRKFTVARKEREDFVAASPIGFGPYRTIAERAKMGAAMWRQKKRARNAELDRLIGLPQPAYNQWLKESSTYYPEHDGVDATDGSHNRAALGHDED